MYRLGLFYARSFCANTPVSTGLKRISPYLPNVYIGTEALHSDATLEDALFQATIEAGYTLNSEQAALWTKRLLFEKKKQSIMDLKKIIQTEDFERYKNDGIKTKLVEVANNLKEAESPKVSN
eukprot:TRINITY_DN1010_c0_g1_i2.p1 TRINITY_DN1010_c0_g1~~TRINITY_DN1010_c0_g1_i2.p1  ORF type:complete len:123 (+),score=13.66 TRINITY_DN1010_c0_g1_i2:52-420(+)